VLWGFVVVCIPSRGLRIPDLSGYARGLLADDERTKPGRDNGRGHHRRDHDFGQGKASLVLDP
jgi:hypothetical protein